MTNGGRIRATSEVQHQFIKVNLEVNEPYVAPIRPVSKLSDADFRDAIEAQFKTMYEMFDRDQVFKSFTKYGEGYALDSNNNINIVFSFSGPMSDNVRVLDRATRRNLFNRLKLWPWFVAPPSNFLYFFKYILIFLLILSFLFEKPLSTLIHLQEKQ